MYRIEIHERFFAGLDAETRATFSVSRGYGRVEVDAHDAHQLLQRPNIDKLMKAIRDVNHSEELTFEQILITDNPPTPGFLLIDRHPDPCSLPSPHPPRWARGLRGLSAPPRSRHRMRTTVCNERGHGHVAV